MKHIASYNIEYKTELTALFEKIFEARKFTFASSHCDQSEFEDFSGVLHVMHNQIVKDLFRPLENKQDELIHAMMGIGGEAGELMDAIKKHVYYDRQLDVENVLEECGDILFYLKAVLMLVGLDISDAEAFNFKKLSARYPDGKFTTLHAAARLDKGAEGAQGFESRHVTHHFNDVNEPPKK